ncbi:MAG: tetratricopeptide repeat protein [Cytophagales bacterium]|nr:tetratricopeptide repeat protein [Cytophagales bacterium]
MKLFLMGFYFLVHFQLFSQKQSTADSLMLIYHKENNDSLKIKLLLKLAFNEVTDLQLALEYAEALIHLGESLNDDQAMFEGWLQKGYKNWGLGYHEVALKAFIEAVDLAIKTKYARGEGAAYSAMASLYVTTKSYEYSFPYFKKAIEVLSKTDDTVALASTILNTGDAFLTIKEYDSALHYFRESGKIFNKLHHRSGQAFTLGNTGMAYANMGETELAERNINQAIDLLEGLGNFYPVCFYLLSMADIFWERGDISEALAYAQRSLDLAVQYELKQQISDANLKLFEFYESQGNSDQALQHYKDYIAYRDSVINLKNVQEIADQRTEFEVSQKQNEIDLQNQEITILEREKELQRTYVAIAFILLVLSGVVILYFRQRFYNTELMAKAERKEHEDEIHGLLKFQETKALQSMVKGKEEERQHLAKELHNHLGSLLATVKVNLNGLDQNHEENKLDTIIGLVDQATQDVRNMSHELHMGVSENFGLIPALQELVNHLQQSKQIRTKLSADLGAIHISSEDEIMIYRIVQELVSNVLKHAGATQLTISLTGFEEDNLISIMVEDNGQGFDPEKLQKSDKGIGLDSLEAMIHQLEGEIHMDSSSGRGTTINVDIPFAIPENQITS